MRVQIYEIERASLDVEEDGRAPGFEVPDELAHGLWAAQEILSAAEEAVVQATGFERWGPPMASPS